MLRRVKEAMMCPITFPFWAFLALGIINLFAFAVWVLARIEV